MAKNTEKKSRLESKLNAPELSLMADRAELKNAASIYTQSRLAAENFHLIYLALRDGSRGTTSHDEQDILRAMLVFACSGLDAVVKQLIRDALASVIECDVGAEREFQKFVERRVKKNGSFEDKDRAVGAPLALDTGLLASLLIHKNPRSALVALMTEGLVGDSLQSRDQLLRVAAHFAITREEVIESDVLTKEAFGARNQIVHEMDVNLGGAKKRHQRSYEDMSKWTANMLKISTCFIKAVEKKLER